MNKTFPIPHSEEAIIEATRFFNLEDPSFIEKDLYVTDLLHRCAPLEDENYYLVFCGGTCLSKAHKAAQRFSEDIDFKIIQKEWDPDIPTSQKRKRLGKFKKLIRNELEQAGYILKPENIRSRDNNMYTQAAIEYSPIFPINEALRPHVKLEFIFSPFKMWTEKLPVTSLIKQVLPKISGHKTVPVTCLTQIETIAEKHVAILRRVAAVTRGYDRHDPTLVRHLYDIHCMHPVFKKEYDLTANWVFDEKISRDRAKFMRHIEFHANTHQELAFGLEHLTNDVIWQQDFDYFLSRFVYGHKDISFHSALGNLTDIFQTHCKGPYHATAAA